MKTYRMLFLAILALPALVACASDERKTESHMHSDHGAAPSNDGHDRGEMSGHEHDSALAPTAGQPGDPAKISRTVAITMDDTLRFNPDQITVKAGETIRFFLTNRGKTAHEMVLGSKEELRKHAEMMRSMPDMQHTEPNMARLQPGQRGGIIWQFDNAGVVDFACLIPGHLEAGMVGRIKVEH